VTVNPSLEDPLRSVEYIAEVFEVRPYTVREWLNTGKMNGVKLPTGTWRVPNSEIVRFANERHGSD
jgi:putative resolvase